MIELMVLGFLATDGPLHGYELRKRMARLHGWTRTMSDGTIYPAIQRLIRAGAVQTSLERGSAAAARRQLSLTDEGRQRLSALLRDADGTDLTDLGRWFVILAFLSLLPDRTERDAVLERRLEFLEHPRAFFGGTSPGADPYHAGILVTARAAHDAELAWLRATLRNASVPAEAPDDETSPRRFTIG